MSLKICTFNVRGLTDVKKRKDVFNYLQSKRYDICCLQETHSTSDNDSRWMTEWGYKTFFTSYASNSRGVGILFSNTFEHEIHNIIKDPEGRYILLDITIHNNRLLLANVYGPNDDNPTFFRNLFTQIQHFQNSSLIIAGDFNVVQNYLKDTINIRGQNNRNAQEVVNDMKHELDLCDPWRSKNPESKICTWHSKLKQSRIDYFLVAEPMLHEIECVNIKPGYRSDHSLVEVTFNFCDQKRGPGMWRFNNSLLRDRIYVEEMKQCIKNTVEQYRLKNEDNHIPNEEAAFSVNDQLLFEVIKLEIRGKTIAYSSAKKRELNNNEKELENNYNKAYWNYTKDPKETNLNNLKNIENDLKTLREKKIEGITMRAKAKWHCEGETNSKYFLNLEQKHYTEKRVHKLIKRDGEEITKIDDILAEQKRFYKDLYSSRTSMQDVERYAPKFFPNDVEHAKLTQEDKNELEQEISRHECLKVLKNMKNGKSPGSDGLTAEFYKFFWNDIGTYLVRSLKETFNIQKLSNFQRLGIITCLPKPGKQREYMKNWRPISLLNIDYKILSSVLANRIKNPLQYLISSCQKGFMKNRNMNECTRLVYDMIHRIDSSKLNGILLLIDYEKAFDSLAWSFIEKTLRYFDFGDNFIKWINILYTDIQSCILNNGFCSDRFSLERGVRQGDPLSPYLFILATEILTLNLKNDPDINGIKIDGSEYLNSLYADDSSIFLEDDENTFHCCMRTLEDFAKCSGLNINLLKTIAIKLGENKTFYQENLGKDICWQWRGKFKLLGIDFDLDVEDITLSNYNKKLNEFQKTLNLWSTRSLTFYGRITIIKSLALPKLVHLFTSLPNPPANILSKIQTSCFNFIWKGTEKIKRTVLYKTYSEGGLKVPNIELFCQTLKISWMKHLFSDLYITEWKSLLYSNIEKFGGNYIWLATDEKPSFKKHLNPFWKDVFDSWRKLVRSDQKPETDCLQEPLFYNKNIKIGGTSIFWKGWHESGINTLHDFVTDNGEFLSWEYIKQRVGNSAHFLQYEALKRAIPLNWKQSMSKILGKLKDQKHPTIIKIQKNEKPSKLAYKLINDAIKTQPRINEQKWEEIFQLKDIDWEKTYTLPYSCTRDKKLQETHFKIIHYILPTNSYLFKCKIKDSPRCISCNLQIETIQHLIWECQKSKSLWLQLADKLLLKGLTYKFTAKNVLLGDNESPILIEHIKLITKHYIFSQKLAEEQLEIQELLNIIKYKSNIEKHYSSDMTNYNKKWEIWNNI